MLGDDILTSTDSTDVDALKEELKFELIVLHSDVKKLDKDWDFSRLIDPLISDQGSALILVPKIKKMITMMTKLKEDFEQRARNIVSVAEFPNKKEQEGFPNKKDGRGRPDKQCKPYRKRQHPPDIAIDEVLPSLGECKRYSR